MFFKSLRKALLIGAIAAAAFADPASWKAHVDNANRALAAGFSAAAVKEAEAALDDAAVTFGRIDKRYVESLKLVGEAYVAAGRLREADQRLREAALAEHPRRVSDAAEATPTEEVYRDSQFCNERVKATESLVKDIPRFVAFFKGPTGMPERAVVANALAIAGDQLINMALCLQTLGKPDEAESVFRNGLDFFLRDAPAALETGRMARSLGDLLRRESRFTEAAESYRIAVALFQRVASNGSSRDPLAAESNENGALQSLGIMLARTGHYDEADACFQQWTDVATHLNVFDQIYLGDLAMLRLAQGYLSDAEDLGQKDTDRKRGIRLASHMVFAYADLGEIYHELKDYAAAAQILRRALELAGAGDDPIAGRIHMTLANVYRELGRSFEANTEYNRAKSIYERRYGAQSPEYAAVLAELGFLRFKQGSRLQAEGLLTQALEITQSALGSKHPSVAHVKRYLAALRQDQRKRTEAEQHYRDALAIMEEALAVDRPVLAPYLADYAAFLRANQRTSDAAPLEKRAGSLAALKTHTPGRARCVIPEVAAVAPSPERRADPFRTAASGLDDPQYLEAARLFAALDYEAALRTLDKLISSFNARPPEDPARQQLLPGAYEMRARVRFALGDPAGAKNDFVALLKLDPAYVPTYQESGASVSPRANLLFQEALKETILDPTGASFETESYRVSLETSRKTDRTVTVVLTFEGLSDTPIPVSLDGTRTYLIGEDGERWTLERTDNPAAFWFGTGGAFSMMGLSRGRTRTANVVFSASGPSKSSTLTLVSVEYRCCPPQSGRQVLLRVSK